jgi:predicted HNH restriction endonuclease
MQRLHRSECYGEFAKHYVEIRHLELISAAGLNGRTTILEDLIVACPNRHRADPADWKPVSVCM